MKVSRRIVAYSSILLPVALSAAAQPHETFSERPSRRQEAAGKARMRAQQEREGARLWARLHGLPVRTVDGDRVVELMAMRDGQPVYYTTLNANAALSTAANQVGLYPFLADGAGLTVGVWDAGSVLSSHVEFGGRISLQDGETATDGHSTHVAGTIAASGINAMAKGMVPAVLIDSYDWAFDEDEMISAAASYAGEPGKIYLSNHSYGILCGWNGSYWYGGNILAGESASFGQYDYFARYWDQIVYDAPYYLPFKAAGNDRDDPAPAEGATFFYYESGALKSNVYNSAIHPLGDGNTEGGYDTIQPKGIAKNIMTVGAIGDAGYGTMRILAYPYAAMSSFSGWGPADDGRIKPDIVANGVGLTSTLGSGDMVYGSMSGTSMATPNACGSAALLVDYYGKRFPGQAMRASTLKGLIIHTADDLGNPGPDYSYGWGLMNTLAAAELLKDYANGNTMRLTEDGLDNGNRSDTFTFFCTGLEPVRVTLCWTDPPGTYRADLDDRSPALVNDLDLKVEDPDGMVHYPFTLDYSNPSAMATASAENDIDNVEQVYIASVVPGKYTITVDVDEPALSGGQQWYSLLVSGSPSDSDDDGMPDLWEVLYFLNPTNGLANGDLDGDGMDNASEYIAGTQPNQTGSLFSVTAYEVSATGSNAPFIVTWDPVAGRVYNVGWSSDLLYAGFTNISGDLPYPAGSYTDAVERAGGGNYYQVDVRLDQ